MKKHLKSASLIVGMVLLTGAVIFGLQALHYHWIKFWKPKYSSVEREVFQNTKSYDFGVQQDLVKYHFEWIKADSIGKKAIENVVRQRFAEYPPNRIKSSEIKRWFKSILNGT